MPFTPLNTLVATNDLAGSIATALEAYGGGSGGSPWLKQSAIGSLAPVTLSGAASCFGDGSGGSNWTEFYGVTVPSSGAMQSVMTYTVKGVGTSAVLPSVGFYDTVSGKVYFFGYYNGGGGNNKWSLGYAAAVAGSEVPIIENNTNSGVFVAPVDTDVIDLVWDPNAQTLVGSKNGTVVFSVTSTDITDAGAALFSPNRAGIYGYIGPTQTAILGQHWGANLQVYKNTPPPLTAGVLSQSGPIYPNMVPWSFTGPAGGLGSPYTAQLKSSATSGSGYANAASLVTGISGSSTNNKVYDTSPTAGVRYYIVTYSDGSVTIDSNEIAVTVPATTAASGLTATGSVLLAGSVGGAAAAATFYISAAFDGDSTTVYHGNSADSSNLTLDAHVAVVPTFLRAMPRRGNDGVSTNYESLLIGDIFEGANVADYSDAVALTLGPAALMGGAQGATIPSPTPALYPGNQYYEFPVVGAASYRYFRLRGAAGSHCDISEFRIGAAAGTAAQAMPCAPVWSPGSGRGIGAGGLTLSCPTTSPGIVLRYNTTNTPVLATDTVYSGAITPPSNAETVYRARAFDALLSTPAGDESEPCTIINPGKLTANTIMRDNRGFKIDAAAGHIIRSKGYYWWSGDGINLVNGSAPDLLSNYPGPLYRSRDLINWEFRGYKLAPVPKAGGGVWPFNERRHQVWNASLHKFVEISHVTEAHTAFAADNLLSFATADTMDGTWTQGSVINPPQYDSVDPQGVGDLYPYQDASGVVFLYYRCVPDSVTIIGKMGADYQSFTGGGSPVSGTDFLRQGYSNREGLVMLLDHANNNVVEEDGTQNYYQSQMTFDYFWAVANAPLSAWTRHAVSPYEGGDPLGTDYNGQLTCALWIPQKGKYVVLSDFWVYGNLSASNPIFQILTLSGTPSVPVLQTVTPGPFNLSDLADVLTAFVVAVSPAPATVAGGATQAFTALVTATGGTPDQDVVWSCAAGSIVNGGANDGLFTAPAQTANTQHITVTATYYDAVGNPTTGQSIVTVPGSSHGRGGLGVSPILPRFSFARTLRGRVRGGN